MIIKNYELQKLKLINLNIFLLYGANSGFKEEVIEKYFTKDFDGKIQKYEEIEEETDVGDAIVWPLVSIPGDDDSIQIFNSSNCNCNNFRF